MAAEAQTSLLGRVLAFLTEELSWARLLVSVGGEGDQEGAFFHSKEDESRAIRKKAGQSLLQ